MADFPAVLIDHAHCERKAATSAIALVNWYPSHDVLVRRLAKLAQEELRHFREVHKLIVARGLKLTRDSGDPYVQQLLKHVRTPEAQRRTDRLLVSSLIEARSSERLQLIADALGDDELGAFYKALATAERGHYTLFVELAALYDDEAVVQARLAELAAAEADIVASLPVEPRIH
jgi:tRNA-(ms[2]io[6]A)-hydroxylase